MRRNNMCGHSIGRRIFHIVLMVIGGILFAGCLAFLFGFGVMYLWNWLMPELFGLKVIGYWQALGIVLLAKILFGCFGHHPGGHGMKHKFKKRIMKFRHHFPEIIENYDEYCSYWEDEGKKAFADYCGRKKNPAE
jgi:hypothetical protein